MTERPGLAFVPHVIQQPRQRLIDSAAGTEGRMHPTRTEQHCLKDDQGSATFAELD